jgi:predicted trehalose synthase
MAPRKYPTQDPELRDIILELSTSFAGVAANVETIKEMTEENHRTLRGSNGDPGMVANLEVVLKAVEQLEENAKAVEALRGEVAEIRGVLKQYPSLTWLARNEKKERLSQVISSPP